MEKKLNKTILRFHYGGEYYEVDWLTDATCSSNEKACDIYNGRGKSAECIGQIIINKKDSKSIIKKMAIAEIRDKK